MLICNNYNNAIRCKYNERLDHLYEQCCDRLTKLGKQKHPAVITQDCVLSFQELDERANQVARFLLKQGIKSGDRIGLLFDRSFQAYIALLGVLKINAAYVPLDGSFPKDRINYIVTDAEVRAIITLSIFEPKLKDSTVPSIFLDSAQDAIAGESKTRLSESEKGIATSQLCYIIYTSGSTGNPKGVAVEHPSICNFVKVAAEVYGYTEKDRVYQGMTIAFDFSVEELWVPLIAGATLVPGKADTNLVGRDLAEFLLKNKITALCCVPTLLATIEEDLPLLRLLLVSGEACPHDLVVRWYRKGRTILNAYGPTEATVTCTWTELYPQKPVTIGQPFPTYSIVILDAEKDQQVPIGQSGEICVAGIGLAKGYVNRDDLTEKAFIPDFLNLPNNPSRRIYRTGDLGRITDDGEIEYQGRIDTQVKIRGYRIELTEIESVLLQLPQIAQAVVNTYAPEGGTPELVAYYTLKDGVADISNSELSETLRSHLPGYMIPAYIEQLSSIPMLPSHKADRKKLPPPKGPRFVARGTDIVAPKSETEKLVASTLADILQIDHVSVKDNFFEDLGAHSLLMAQFCAKLRGQSADADVSMRDIYLHPSVAQLSDFLNSRRGTKPATRTVETYRKPTKAAYYTCGTFQLISYYGLFFSLLGILVAGLIWSFSSTSIIVIYLRLLGFVMFTATISMILPVLMKWVLIGKWKKEKIPIWSVKYFRFWIVKLLIQNNPMVLFKGLPIYNWYLRILGAKIGKHAVIYSKLVPVCTDLIDIGENTILRKDSIFLGYKAQSGYIYTGPITIGKNGFVGGASFLDIDTTMGDDTQLGHASSLQSNQKIPRGKRYHGSPAEETTVNYCSVEPKRCSTLRRFTYSVLHFASLSLAIPTILLIFYVFFSYYFGIFSDFVARGNILLIVDDLRSAIVWFSTNFNQLFILFILFIFSLALVFVLLLFGLLVIAAFPRLLHLLIREEKTYILYSVHYYVFKLIFRISNSYFFNLLFGDSSYILSYLNLIGIKASKVEQTGSNFGTSQKHDYPFLCEIDDGTMVSDGLSMINASISNTSFKLSKVSIGKHNFFGNNVQYPHRGKLGANCLIATKAMIPIDGHIRENTGILGSPSFEIPRSVDRDKNFESYEEPSVRQERIHKKNIYNLYTIAAFLISRWGYGFLSILFLYLTILLFGYYGFLPVALFLLGFPIFSIGYFVLIEWMSLGFKRMSPQICSIYDKNYWKVEHYWKMSEPLIMMLFKGTPLKNVISRLVGIKLGKQVFDDGGFATEKTLVEIGDYCNLNEASTLQSHSLEEGVFKSDHIKIGKGNTIGGNALIHYGCTIGDNVVIGTDSFVMKGETVESNSIWRGNPARETTSWVPAPISQEQSQEAKLVIAKKGKLIKEFSLNGHCLTIGRGPESDIRLPERKISRTHARIVDTPNGHRLEDLTSTHGTYVNGKRIAEYDLKMGDIIKIHNYQLSYKGQTDIASEKKITRTSPTHAPTSPRQSHDAKLIVVKKGKLLKEFSLNGDCLTIGRGPENDIRLHEEEISRTHARIVDAPNGHRLEDLTSTNGTYVNGKRIAEYDLKMGDVIEIIDYQISYERQLNAASE
jgi:non-ribosomal peptide synthetase-like protein